MDHDFKEPIEKTSVGLAKVIVQNLIENFDTFVYEDIDITDEKKADLDEKGIDFSISLMSMMASTDIPADYASYPIDKLIAALSAIKKYIDGTVRQQHDELLSRVIGAKSPVSNTYAKDCASLGQLMLALNKVRHDQGNKMGDYFIPVTKEGLSTGPETPEEKMV